MEEKPASPSCAVPLAVYIGPVPWCFAAPSASPTCALAFSRTAALTPCRHSCTCKPCSLPPSLLQLPPTVASFSMAPVGPVAAIISKISFSFSWPGKSWGTFSAAGSGAGSCSTPCRPPCAAARPTIFSCLPSTTDASSSCMSYGDSLTRNGLPLPVATPCCPGLRDADLAALIDLLVASSRRSL